MTKRAFTLIELVIVVLILGLLATIAVGVFTSQVERARYAAARSTISALEVAINRYQIDVGDFPPSGSYNSGGTQIFEGTGLLHLALTRSMSGDALNPASPRWQGPYIDVKDLYLGDMNGFPIDDPTSPTTLIPGQVQILDPWRLPYRYVRCCGSTTDEYPINNATHLPSTNPFASTDIYYNPQSFQIVSNGRDGNTETLVPNQRGTEEDDVTNFGF